MKWKKFNIILFVAVVFGITNVPKILYANPTILCDVNGTAKNQVNPDDQVVPLNGNFTSPSRFTIYSGAEAIYDDGTPDMPQIKTPKIRANENNVVATITCEGDFGEGPTVNVWYWLKTINSYFGPLGSKMTHGNKITVRGWYAEDVDENTPVGEAEYDQIYFEKSFTVDCDNGSGDTSNCDIVDGIIDINPLIPESAGNVSGRRDLKVQIEFELKSRFDELHLNTGVRVESGSSY